MASLDDRPLETSLRILLTLAGRDRNTGQTLAMNPTNDKPLLLKFKQGKNVLRLTNLNGRGVNVDYLALTSPDVKVTRELLTAKVKNNAQGCPPASSLTDLEVFNESQSGDPAVPAGAATRWQRGNRPLAGN
jgi:hypothetical protein